MTAPWPRRPRLVVGNWKMNKTAGEAAALVADLAARLGSVPASVAVCPPFTALPAVRAALGSSPIALGAQNLSPEPAGPFTGEISGAMLAEAGCRFVIVGHSERRHGLGEDDAVVARKLRAAQRASLIPIVCVGETLAEREAGRTDEVLGRQVRAAYSGLDGAAARTTVIAYEPVWAIGTGKVATPDQAVAAHRRIRATLDAMIDRCGNDIAILYGGSVSPSNAAALFAESEIDGALVGGASLEAASFLAIVAAA